MNREERRKKLHIRQLGEKKSAETAAKKEEIARKALEEAENQDNSSFKDELKFEKPELETKFASPEFVEMVEIITNHYKRPIYDIDIMRSIYTGLKNNPKFKTIKSLELLKKYQRLVEKVNKNLNPEEKDYLSAYKKTQAECESAEEVFLLSNLIKTAEEMVKIQNDDGREQ